MTINNQKILSLAKSIRLLLLDVDGVLTDDILAAQYRSQADALYKEAKLLRSQAEDLVPTVKKAAKKTTASA